MGFIAGGIVMGFALSLLALAWTIAFRPRRAERFLSLFASSAKAHYLEQALRLIVGLALLGFAPSMRWSTGFEILGWLITVTAIGLLLIPWRWHHRFGRWAIPLVLRHLRWYALAAGTLGVFILWAALHPLL